MNRTILSISSFDSSCATGIGADLKTFQAFRLYGAGVVTAVCAQNTMGMQAMQAVPMEMVGQQLEAVAGDIKIHAVKVGVLASAANARIVASLLGALDLGALVVVDPVLVSSTGEHLLDQAGIDVLRQSLLPLATVVTPNMMEAERLSETPVKDIASAKEAAKRIFDLGPRNVVITGGALVGTRAMDLWYDGNGYHVYDAAKIPTQNVLGIGGTFAAALCALLAKGCLMGEGGDRAKKYVTSAIQHPFTIGKGKGPLNHAVPI